MEEINEANGRVIGDPRFVDIRYELIDLLAADLSEIELPEIDEPAAMDRAAALTSPRLRVALVVTQPESVQLCLRYIEESKAFGSTWEFALFSRIEEAEEWGSGIAG